MSLSVLDLVPVQQMAQVTALSPPTAVTAIAAATTSPSAFSRTTRVSLAFADQWAAGLGCGGLGGMIDEAAKLLALRIVRVPFAQSPTEHSWRDSHITHSWETAGGRVKVETQ